MHLSLRLRLREPLRKNDPRFEINASWTTIEDKYGWRHFRIVDRRWSDKKLEVELMAVCDREVRFWIEAKEMGDPALYITGWRDLPLSQINKKD